MNRQINQLHNFVILAVCASFMPGCASDQSQLHTLKPVYRVQSESQNYFYDLGKQAFARAEYGLAIDAFQRALRENGKSIMALNGLAACYDKLQRYEVAAGYYYKALQIDPDSARTLNNIGYSLLMQGRAAEANVVLKLALHQSPKDGVIEENLVLAKNSLGIQEQTTAKVAVAASQAEAVGAGEPVQAIALPQENYVARKVIEREPSGQCTVDIFSSEERLDRSQQLSEYLARNSGTTTCITSVPAFDCEKTVIYYNQGKHDNAELVASLLPVAAQLQESQGKIGTDVRVVPGDDIMDVALAPRDPSPTLASSTAKVVDVPLSIEVSNGNGRDGMARLLGEVLKRHGQLVARVTNAGHFHFAHTVVYYAPGWRQQAERLAGSLPVKAQLTESDAIYRTTTARIVLGADFLEYEKSLHASLNQAI